MDDAAGKVNRAKVYAELGAERKPMTNSIFRVNSADEEVVTRVRLDRLIFMEAWQAGFSVSLRCAGRPSGFMAVSTSKWPVVDRASRMTRFTRDSSQPLVSSFTSALARLLQLENVGELSYARVAKEETGEVSAKSTFRFKELRMST